MEGYLGEFDIDVSSTPFADFTPSDWALYWIGSYGQIDGAHHKAWVLDQVARILHGTGVVVKEARWQTGHTEYRVRLSKPGRDYDDWVKDMKGEYDQDYDEYEYSYDPGIAP